MPYRFCTEIQEKSYHRGLKKTLVQAGESGKGHFHDEACGSYLKFQGIFSASGLMKPRRDMEIGISKRNWLFAGIITEAAHMKQN